MVPLPTKLCSTSYNSAHVTARTSPRQPAYLIAPVMPCKSPVHAAAPRNFLPHCFNTHHLNGTTLSTALPPLPARPYPCKVLHITCLANNIYNKQSPFCIISLHPSLFTPPRGVFKIIKWNQITRILCMLQHSLLFFNMMPSVKVKMHSWHMWNY